MLNSILLILFLIAVSAFFSLSEISLAASRKIKLKLMADEGNVNAARVLKLQETPGIFFTVVQIGLNAVAILGGIVGDAAFSGTFQQFFIKFLSPELAEQVSFICSFVLVTSLFILFADLTPKRIGMIAPETVAVRIINPMRFSIMIFRPLVWFFNGMANLIFRMFKLPMVRKDDITSDDIYAVVEAGATAGVLRKQEHELIENVFELESRTVPSSMTSRESVVYFDLRESEESIKEKVSTHPHSSSGVRRPYRSGGRLRRFQRPAEPRAGQPEPGAEQRRADPFGADRAGYADAVRSVGKLQDRRRRLRGDPQ